MFIIADIMLYLKMKIARGQQLSQRPIRLLFEFNARLSWYILQRQHPAKRFRKRNLPLLIALPDHSDVFV